MTFTQDKELVCRHAQNDLHTTTNILVTPLAAKCTKGFAPAAALRGPVLITDRGHPAFVMLNIDEHHRLQGKAPSLFAQMQQLPELPDDVLEIPRMDVEFRDVEF